MLFLVLPKGSNSACTYIQSEYIRQSRCFWYKLKHVASCGPHQGIPRTIHQNYVNTACLHVSIGLRVTSSTQNCLSNGKVINTCRSLNKRKILKARYCRAEGFQPNTEI